MLGAEKAAADEAAAKGAAAAAAAAAATAAEVERERSATAARADLLNRLNTALPTRESDRGLVSEIGGVQFATGAAQIERGRTRESLKIRRNRRVLSDVALQRRRPHRQHGQRSDQ